MSSWQDKAIKALKDSLHPIPQELNGKNQRDRFDPFRQVKIYLEFDIIDYFCKRNEIWNKNK